MYPLHLQCCLGAWLPTPYPDLNLVLQDLTNNVQATLKDNFVGAYLQGSFAIGDFDRHSDVDFLIVIAEELTNQEVEAQAMSEYVFRLDSAWAQHLEPIFQSTPCVMTSRAVVLFGTSTMEHARLFKTRTATRSWYGGCSGRRRSSWQALLPPPKSIHLA